MGRNLTVTNQSGTIPPKLAHDWCLHTAVVLRNLSASPKFDGAKFVEYMPHLNNEWPSDEGKILGPIGLCVALQVPMTWLPLYLRTLCSSLR